ncbi:hypothetical protein EJ04DRAFT_507573 [Polyplosphaeria fusca]|uniref:Uncharacterized protein n=1 Tax=Polyplosphaeria fusca TaxID=682080 RepID=A0A9P4RCM0_9PLEO|nr:hypothetical protein EJ04DRAFT_507573 [Polyplosphaeria fusca]
MDKVKKVLHVRRKSKMEPETKYDDAANRPSVDEELAAMSPEEREKYLKEFDEAEQTGSAKKGSFLDKLIERGNKKTEEQITREAKEKEARDGVIH